MKFPKPERTLYPPLLSPGSELAWGTLAGRNRLPNAVDAYRFLAHKNPDVGSPDRFDIATDFELMENAGEVLNTVTPDLRPFFKRGGKLLMYHGWNDRQVPAMSSVTYFERVLETAGRSAAGAIDSALHGSGHGSLSGWRRHRHVQQGRGDGSSGSRTGSAPAHIVASHSTEGKVDRTRPLCPYPQIARYKGTGASPTPKILPVPTK